ncbi:unnamed protein product [Sphenostylis stenocarpa]|uniref:Uncharacterized protein n=1 Tax=Sphenostylis stenocarpa TaxID=92480 RepID=A0AA86SUF9_9FABA|nr:unnamed protein product [Sphenostylis stenocarpa]
MDEGKSSRSKRPEIPSSVGPTFQAPTLLLEQHQIKLRQYAQHPTPEFNHKVLTFLWKGSSIKRIHTRQSYTTSSKKHTAAYDMHLANFRAHHHMKKAKKDTICGCSCLNTKGRDQMDRSKSNARDNCRHIHWLSLRSLIFTSIVIMGFEELVIQLRCKELSLLDVFALST